MPKVLRIINRFNLGGPTYNAAYLTKYMSPEFETLLAGGAKDKTEKNSEYIVRNLGIEPVIIPEMKRTINLMDDFIAYNKIKKIIRNFKPDIVHTHASKAGALGRRAAYRLKVPVVIHTFHGHVFDSYFGSYQADFYKSIERKLAKKTTKIIAISENQKDDLVSKYHICSEDKIEIIPLGFDLSRFRENMDLKRKVFRRKYNISDDEIAIGIIGRVVPIKNHTLFLESLKYIKGRTTRKVRAFIVGDGEDRINMEEKATSLGIDYVNYCYENRKSILTFTSWIKEIDEVMAGMDIIALTSLNEGTPVSLIEAQAASKPVVTTNVGGIENAVIPNKTALLSETNDVERFSENLLSLIGNDNLRNELSKEGWNFVKNKYHYTRLVEDMVNLYKKLLLPDK